MNHPEQEIGPNEFEIEPDDASLPDGSAYRWQPWPPRARVARWLRMRWRETSALLALLVITLSLAGAMPPTLPKASAPPVAIDVGRDGITCLQELTWAPDSRRVAILGYWLSCPVQDYSYKPSLLNIYSADSGRLLRKIAPDAAILQALQQLSGAMAPTASKTAPLIFYTALIWSRQAQRLALTFSIWITPPPSASALNGVLLLDEDGGHERALLQPTIVAAPYEEWDVQSGALLPVRTPFSDSTPFFSNLPTAPTYRWGKDGTLLPESQDGPTSPLPDLIGNPVGDAAFSFWQPGQVDMMTAVGPTYKLPGAYLWRSSFAAWSPDGRYLVDSLSLVGRMQPADIAPPSHQALVALNVDQTPLLAVRDAALLGLLHLLALAHGGFSTQSLVLAWRPDGRVLAAYGYVVNRGLTVNLYDATTNQQVDALPAATPGGTPELLWSPDGSRMLMQNGEAITIWQPDLPEWL